MLLLDQYLLQVPVIEKTAVTFYGLPHTPQHPGPALQVLPELWPVLNFAFCGNPFSGKTLTHCMLTLCKYKNYVWALLDGWLYLQLCIFTRISGKKQKDLFQPGENVYLGMKLMESRNEINGICEPAARLCGSLTQCNINDLFCVKVPDYVYSTAFPFI